MTTALKKRKIWYFSAVWTGLLTAGFGFVAVYIGVIHNEPEIATLASLLGAVFLALLIKSILMIRNHKVVMDDEGVEVTSLFGRTTKLKWHEINNVKYNPLLSPAVTIKAKDGKTVVISKRSFSDFENLLSMMNQKVTV